MQRCPYLHEMKERLLGQPTEQQMAMEPLTKGTPHDTPPSRSPIHHEPSIGTVVKLNPDGYGSHTSPTHQCTPLVPHEPDNDYYYTETRTRPKNAKTSLFIIMSFIYAKLLVVICIAYVISDGITHNLPLYYYEGFFTYLYGMSIFFLLYVFCFLLPDFGCCYVDTEKKPPKEKKVKPSKEEKEKKKKEDKKAKEKEKKDKKEKEKEKQEKEKEKDTKKEKETDKKKKHQFQLEVYPRKMRDIVRLKLQEEQLQQMQELLTEARTATLSGSNHNIGMNNVNHVNQCTNVDGWPPTKCDNNFQNQNTQLQNRRNQSRGPPYEQKSTYRPNTEFIVDCNLNTPTSTTTKSPSSTNPASPDPLDSIIICNNDTIINNDDDDDQAYRVIIHPQDNVDLEAAVTTRASRKRKTAHDNANGSFFLRIGAIAFGLGTMIYNGLELGTEFEVPMTSPCYEILRVVNPILQMLFTFMQMYFIFLNSRVNILRFKVIARFGLMHICATNLCVWIRTLVLEYLKEITTYHQTHPPHPNDGLFAESIRQHTLLNAGKILGTERGGYAAAAVGNNNGVDSLSSATSTLLSTSTISTTTSLSRQLRSTARSVAAYAAQALTTTTTQSPPSPTTTLFPTTTTHHFTTPSTIPSTTLRSTTLASTTSTTPIPITTPSTTTFQTTPTTIPTTIAPPTTMTTEWAPMIETTIKNTVNNLYNNLQVQVPSFRDLWIPPNDTYYNFNDIIPAALASTNETMAAASVPPPPLSSTNCGRTNIMGNFVQDATPYLYPFIIEYSLIGAAVIYVMWKNIGRNPRYVSEEDLEHRLEVMLSRRAVAMAHAQHGRVDCVGASKGLFFGLLLLVGSLICLILFFVLIHHPELGLLAIYLADVSHCALMVLSIIAIIIGFIRATKLRSIYAYRVQHLKFRSEEQSDLNDILLRVSAFGLFIYAVFSVIAGSLNALTNEPNLLVMITGILSIVQVVLQLLFVADVARRRVHLPEHDRSKPGRQVVTFLLICNVTMWIIYTFEMQKVEANPVQLDFYGFATWAIIQRITLPLCIFHRFHSAVTLAEIWKTSYKARLE